MNNLYLINIIIICELEENENSPLLERLLSRVSTNTREQIIRM